MTDHQFVFVSATGKATAWRSVIHHSFPLLLSLPMLLLLALPGTRAQSFEQLAVVNTRFAANIPTEPNPDLSCEFRMTPRTNDVAMPVSRPGCFVARLEQAEVGGRRDWLRLSPPSSAPTVRSARSVHALIFSSLSLSKTISSFLQKSSPLLLFHFACGCKILDLFFFLFVFIQIRTQYTAKTIFICSLVFPVKSSVGKKTVLTLTKTSPHVAQLCTQKIALWMVLLMAINIIQPRRLVR